jgi:hypothetical protein
MQCAEDFVLYRDLVYYAFTTAALPPPTILRAVTTTPTSIALTWDQTEGADAVNRYEINYRYFINECELESDGGRPFPPVTVLVNDGSLRRYTVNSSASTPVEEDSAFRITLTSVNSVTRSVPSQPAMATTAEAGTCCILLVIGVSLSEPHINGTALCEWYVYIYIYIYIYMCVCGMTITYCIYAVLIRQTSNLHSCYIIHMQAIP